MSEFFKPHNVVSLFLGLAGLVFGIYSFYESKPKYEISYNVDRRVVSRLASFGLVAKDPKTDAEINHNVCETNILFWVTGNSVIEEKVIRRPIAIIFPQDPKIIRFDIVARAASEQMTLTQNERGVIAKFGYLDPGAGARVRFLHDCAAGFPSITGSTIGDLPILKQVDTSKRVLPVFVVFMVLWIVLGPLVIRFSDKLDELMHRRSTNPKRLWWAQRLVFFFLIIATSRPECRRFS